MKLRAEENLYHFKAIDLIFGISIKNNLIRILFI